MSANQIMYAMACHRPPRSGHECLASTGSQAWEIPGFPFASSGALDNQMWRSSDKKQGAARVHHVDGWTILGIHDYTGDSRGNSNATFTIEGVFTVQEMLAIAREKFPKLMTRVGQITEVTK